MKPRTRFLASFLLVYSAIAFIALVGTLQHYGGAPRTAKGIAWGLLGLLLFWGLQWPFWWAVVKRKAWAWWVLVVGFAGFGILGFLSSIQYLLTHLHEGVAQSVAIAVGDVLIYGGVAWLLLTDRPGGWSRSAAQP